jgi:thymidylate kinase
MRGLIVITDRYPQNQTASYNDGPLLAHLRRVPLWIRRFETAVYARARRLPPDLVIKLQTSPETNARREPEMHPSRIQRRVAALKCLEFPGARVVCVDAEQPLADVLRTVKREIWRVL